MPLIQRKPGGEAYEFTTEISHLDNRNLKRSREPFSAVRDVSYHLEEERGT